MSRYHDFPKILALNPVGTYYPFFRLAGRSLPVYRVVCVTEYNYEEDDVNNLVQVAIGCDESNAEQIDGHPWNVVKAGYALLMAACSPYLVSLSQKKIVEREGMRYAAFEVMDLGSIYNLIARAHADGGLPYQCIRHVLFRVAQALHYLSTRFGGEFNRHEFLSAAYIYMNRSGDVKLGHHLTGIIYDNDSMLVPTEWPFIPPKDIGTMLSPYGSARNMDAESKHHDDVWHFGILALELIYSGLRTRLGPDFHFFIDGMLETQSMPSIFSRTAFTQDESGAFKHINHFFTSTAQLSIPHLHMPQVLAGSSKPKGKGPTIKLERVPLKEEHPKRQKAVPEDLKMLILSCLSHNPKERPTIEQLSNDRALTTAGAYDMMPHVWT